MRKDQEEKEEKEEKKEKEDQEEKEEGKAGYRKNRGYKDKGTESRWSLLGEEVWQEERAALT